MNGSTGTIAVMPRVPRGMTLVELLVVTGLMAVFLGLVVVGVRGGGSAEQKRGAETLAAVLAAAQGRALGVPEGAAAILGADGTSAAACTALFDAVMQPLIEATCTVSAPSPASTTATVTVTPTNGDDVQRAYKIVLFGADAPTAPPSAWLAFTPPSTVAFRGVDGQTAANTVWPKAAVSGTSNGLLAQYPAKSSAVIDLDASTAVDLRFSGIGDDRTTPYGRLDGRGSIAIVFDRVGRVGEVIQQVPEPGASVAAGTPQPAVPTSTIYFLVAPRSLVTSGSNTLASEDSTWVALAPQTGRIFVADNVVQTGTDTNALRAAREKARRGIGTGK